jgi:hypothetical protein
MTWKNLNRRRFLHLAGAAILVAGLALALLIYLRAGQETGARLGYEGGDGTVYPIRPEDNKQYLRDLELYGGKANVLADEFRRWLWGFGEGKSLAYLVAGATIIVAAGFFLAANAPELPPESEEKEGYHREDTEA